MRYHFLTFALAVILIVLHYFYACFVGYYLYQQSGGIHTDGKWTHYGGAPYAWTIPIQLPGGFIMAYEDKVSNPHTHDRNGASLGFCLVLAGSVVTAYALASVLVTSMTRHAPIFGRYKWKAAVIVLGLIWIPVPETMAWVYQITVIY